MNPLFLHRALYLTCWYMLPPGLIAGLPPDCPIPCSQIGPIGPFLKGVAGATNVGDHFRMGAATDLRGGYEE